jgi:hypothetical protein
MSDSLEPANDAEWTSAVTPSPSPQPSPDGEGGDLEIQALLGFEPAPRKRVVEGAWTPDLQREFIARLAVTGSIGRAAEEMGKTDSGVRKLYRSPGGAGFRAAWHSAVELAKRRKGAATVTDEPAAPGSRPPSLDGRRKHRHFGSLPGAGDGEEGRMVNEYGEWEDEGSLRRRADEARDSISRKLLAARRLYLQEISASAGKRAAFEILTLYPIDWGKAAELEPQDDEPWRRVSMRKPDMLLTAENGWLGDVAHGRDKKAELMRAIDEHRAAEGLPPVDWGESTERNEDDA